MNTLTLGDIAVMISLIDVVTKRGAFEGVELLEVGQMRQKLQSVIDDAKAATDAANAEAAKPGLEEAKTEETSE